MEETPANKYLIEEPLPELPAELEKPKRADIKWWWYHLAAWMMSNPDKNMRDAAKYFDCTPQTIYLIKNSDGFQNFYHEKMGALVDKTGDILVEKSRRVAEQALDAISSRLENDLADVIPLESLADLADTNMKRLGYAANAKSAPPGGSVQVNVLIDKGALASAREKMRQQFGEAADRLNEHAAPGSPLALEHISEGG